MHCLCVVAVYVLSLCCGSHVYRQDVEADSFPAVSLSRCILLKHVAYLLSEEAIPDFRSHAIPG